MRQGRCARLEDGAAATSLLRGGRQTGIRNSASTPFLGLTCGLFVLVVFRGRNYRVVLNNSADFLAGKWVFKQSSVTGQKRALPRAVLRQHGRGDRAGCTCRGSAGISRMPQEVCAKPPYTLHLNSLMSDPRPALFQFDERPPICPSEEGKGSRACHGLETARALEPQGGRRASSVTRAIAHRTGEPCAGTGDVRACECVSFKPSLLPEIADR